MLKFEEEIVSVLNYLFIPFIWRGFVLFVCGFFVGFFFVWFWVGLFLN